jgi:2-amino-4-hydroxy-6-hydroxymethyldihydropteridine diphosphokinase
MTRAYVGIGSNIAPEENIPRAVRLLARRVRLIGTSTFYRSEAVPPGGPEFVDGAVAIETGMGPYVLKYGVLREVEARLGRVRSEDKNAPRTIDCDLLLHGEEVVCQPDMVLPAPDIREYAFIAIPLLEVAPELVLPDTGTPLADVVARLPRRGLWPLPDFTSEVRKELEEVRDGSFARGAARSRASR